MKQLPMLKEGERIQSIKTVTGLIKKVIHHTDGNKTFYYTDWHTNEWTKGETLPPFRDI